MAAMVDPARERPAPPQGDDPAQDSAEALVARVLDGSPAAWTALVAHIHPLVVAMCQRRRLGAALSAAEDVPRDVAARTLERLRADDFAALRRFAATRERYPQASLERWLGAVVGNTFIDYLRAHPEYERKRDAHARKLVKRQLAPLDEGTTARQGGLDVQTAIEVRRILAFLLDTGFPAEQRRALLLWLQGHRPGEIADALALAGPDEASRLLHAARQRLRRRFER